MRVLPFETAAELHTLLLRGFPTATSRDGGGRRFIPQQASQRLHREDGDQSVLLKAGRDILASLAPLHRSHRIIAFAAETSDFEVRGRRKMEQKGADLIVVNDVGRTDIGFDSKENEVLILGRDGTRETISRRSKREVADKIWDALLAAQERTPG
jgi:phosphopantothenoylcysteine decarboxylase/phosphopantothenate--cysteine ligase